jgi:hypothetical protein
VRSHTFEEVGGVCDDDDLEGESCSPALCVTVDTFDGFFHEQTASRDTVIVVDFESMQCGVEFGLLAGRRPGGLVDWCAEVVGRRGSKVDTNASNSIPCAIARACAINVDNECALLNIFSFE